MKIPQVFTLIRYFFYLTSDRTAKLNKKQQEQKKSHEFLRKTSISVGAEGFEPPTLCV